MIYGHNRTIHNTRHLDVQLDKEGNVAAVWYRCLMLPFCVSEFPVDNADSLRAMKSPGILAIEVTDEVSDDYRPETQDMGPFARPTKSSSWSKADSGTPGWPVFVFWALVGVILGCGLLKAIFG